MCITILERVRQYCLHSTIALNILFAHEAEAAAEIKVLHLCTVSLTQMDYYDYLI